MARKTFCKLKCTKIFFGWGIPIGGVFSTQSSLTAFGDGTTSHQIGVGEGTAVAQHQFYGPITYGSDAFFDRMKTCMWLYSKNFVKFPDLKTISVHYRKKIMIQSEKGWTSLIIRLQASARSTTILLSDLDYPTLINLFTIQAIIRLVKNYNDK